MPKRHSKDPLIPSTAFADAWIQVDNTADPQFFVNVLDATRAQLLERARDSPEAFFEPFAPTHGLNVLDVGCGTGDLLRLLAPLVAPGRAIGIDLSETMIAEANSRSGPSSSNLSFVRGDVFNLQFEDGAFERVMANQVLVHLPSPWSALAEMCRVLAPDGMISITEMDWGTMVVESSHRELSRRFTQLTCDGLRNGLIARELSGRLGELGFKRVVIHPDVRVAQNLDSFHRWFIVPSLSHFRRMGAISQAESDALLGDLEARAIHGRYFSSLTSYSIIARR
jgi:SAM-dependent methyltransferase